MSHFSQEKCIAIKQTNDSSAFGAIKQTYQNTLKVHLLKVMPTLMQKQHFLIDNT